MNVHRFFTTSSDIVFFHVQLAWHRKYHIWAAISVSKILPILPRSKPSQVSEETQKPPIYPAQKPRTLQTEPSNLKPQNHEVCKPKLQELKLLPLYTLKVYESCAETFGKSPQGKLQAFSALYVDIDIDKS